MNTDVIKGRAKNNNPATPMYALGEFYYAFNNQDLAVMETIWHQSDDSSMNNPVGGIMRGWKDIRKVYERLFQSGARVFVEFYDYQIMRIGETFIAVGRERGFAEKNGTKLDLAIHTSRTFIMVGKEWKQFHHHGSIENPELLKKYQNLFKS
jgi:hypothetical protein